MADALVIAGIATGNPVLVGAGLFLGSGGRRYHRRVERRAWWDNRPKERSGPRIPRAATSELAAHITTVRWTLAVGTIAMAAAFVVVSILENTVNRGTWRLTPAGACPPKAETLGDCSDWVRYPGVGRCWRPAHLVGHLARLNLTVCGDYVVFDRRGHFASPLYLTVAWVTGIVLVVTTLTQLAYLGCTDEVMRTRRRFLNENEAVANETHQDVRRYPRRVPWEILKWGSLRETGCCRYALAAFVAVLAAGFVAMAGYGCGTWRRSTAKG